jgi:membrane protein YdbS with pleckstrin-like domain
VQPLPDSVRRLWRLTAVGTGAATVAFALIADLSSRTVLDPPVPPVVVPVLLGAAVGAVGWWWATVRYRSWRFELTDEWVRARWGVVTHRTATIPRNRVQTVTSQNGPIDRILGLTSVVIHTAGIGAPNLAIPHLADDTVEWLRHELARGTVR